VNNTETGTLGDAFERQIEVIRSLQAQFEATPEHHFKELIQISELLALNTKVLAEPLLALKWRGFRQLP
jgi:hypothetical protein